MNIASESDILYLYRFDLIAGIKDALKIMLIFRLFVICSAVLGAAAGVIRSFELSVGYTEGGLPVDGCVWRTVLTVLCLCVVLATALISFGMTASKKRISPFLFCQTPKVLDLLYFLCVGAFALAGSFELFGCAGRFSSLRLISGLMLLLSAAMLILTSRLLLQAKFPKEFAPTVLVPTFWCSFCLILNFREQTQNPVVVAYIFDILATVFLLLTLYCHASLLFRKKVLRRTFFCASLCVFFNVLCLVGNFGRVLESVSLKADIFDQLALFAPLAICAGAVFFGLYVSGCLLRSSVQNEPPEEECPPSEQSDA